MSFACVQCGKSDANYICSKCKSVHYCSRYWPFLPYIILNRECQKSNWNKHKLICGKNIVTKPIQKPIPTTSVQSSTGLSSLMRYVEKKYSTIKLSQSVKGLEKLGRTLVALKSFEKRDILLTEEPFALISNDEKGTCCFNCHENIDKEYQKCSYCRCAFCSQACAEEHNIHSVCFCFVQLMRLYVMHSKQCILIFQPIQTFTSGCLRYSSISAIARPQHLSLIKTFYNYVNWIIPNQAVKSPLLPQSANVFQVRLRRSSLRFIIDWWPTCFRLRVHFRKRTDSAVISSVHSWTTAAIQTVPCRLLVPHYVFQLSVWFLIRIDNRSNRERRAFNNRLHLQLVYSGSLYLCRKVGGWVGYAIDNPLNVSVHSPSNIERMKSFLIRLFIPDNQSTWPGWNEIHSIDIVDSIVGHVRNAKQHGLIRWFFIRLSRNK